MQSEQQYLQNYDPSQFEHPSVTVDILIFTVTDKKLHLLLIRRNTHPFLGKWAIPGGFLRIDESADEAAARRIREEAGVKDVHLEQLYTFSAVNRDPRTRVISIAYLATVPFGKLHYSAGTGADEALAAVALDVAMAAAGDLCQLFVAQELNLLVQLVDVFVHILIHHGGILLYFDAFVAVVSLDHACIVPPLTSQNRHTGFASRITTPNR